MKPRQSQIDMAEQGFAILKEHAMVYLAAEERTGKTLASLLIAEKCPSIRSVLVLTKKAALGGWKDTLKKCPWLTKKYTVTNYHQAKKLTANFDLVMLDEAHNYISTSPKPSTFWKSVKPLTNQLPIIFISATPHAQGYHQLYHQLALSSWTPWKQYKTFYRWFEHYGIPSSIMMHGRVLKLYTKTLENAVQQDVKHLFITKTRKELGFEHEPEDRLHFIDLTQSTKDLYNAILRDRVVELSSKHTLVCDSPMKLRTSLHMVEGGVAKVDGDYVSLANTEKIDYIKKTWGDTNNIAIFYHYIEEGNKLRRHFRHAKILQGTRYAEGIDLSNIKYLVIYSQDFSTARHSQRRARQANFKRKEEIAVNFLLCENAVSAQVYTTVAKNKQNFVDSVFDRLDL